ncbi:hypothetical protein ABIA42_007858 [Bradyrhizobium sp. USDA 327]
MLDGLAQRLLLRLLQGARVGPVEAGGEFAVGAEHFGEEGSRRLVMPGPRALGNWPQHHPPGEGGILGGAQRRQASRRAGAQALDRGTDDHIRQRHVFGTPDDRGNDAHAPPELRASADTCSSKRRFRSGFPRLSPKLAHPALFLGGRCAIVRTASKLT